FPLRILFLSAFRRFSFGELDLLTSNPARAIRIVLIRSSNRSLSGNCDSSRLETCLNYLTQLGTVSHRPSSPGPSFAFSARERARGTRESCLARAYAPVSEE